MGTYKVVSTKTSVTTGYIEASNEQDLINKLNPPDVTEADGSTSTGEIRWEMSERVSTGGLTSITDLTTNDVKTEGFLEPNN